MLANRPNKKKRTKFNHLQNIVALIQLLSRLQTSALSLKKKFPGKVRKDKLKLILLVKKTSEKGYVRLVTSLGNINIRLHCDLAPLTCENFLIHCEKGYYNGTIFHRSIRHFMIQGGKGGSRSLLSNQATQPVQAKVALLFGANHSLMNFIRALDMTERVSFRWLTVE